MPPVQVLLIGAAVVGLYFGGRAVVHGVEKLDRKVCHVVTLGHKCKPAQKPAAPPKQ
jgi:hypothetical protein